MFCLQSAKKKKNSIVLEISVLREPIRVVVSSSSYKTNTTGTLSHSP